MHDRNIAVVFAAGNDGDAPDMINPYSVAPWVISVAAAEKQGVERATRTLRNVKSAWVKEMRVSIENGKIAEYQVNMQVTFVLDD